MEVTVPVVWAVVFSNYEPAEVDSLWAVEELAETRAGQLDHGWEVVRMYVGTSIEVKPT